MSDAHIMDITPGRMVEHDGELYLIEDVVIEVTMQRIESYQEEIAGLFDGQPGTSRSPMFTRIRGRIGEDQFDPDRFKLLYKAEEL